MSAILYSTTAGEQTSQVWAVTEDIKGVPVVDVHLPRGMSADMLRVTVFDSGVALVKKFR